MKKTLNILFLIALTFIVCLFSACTEKANGADEGPMTLVQLEDLYEYVIVRPKNADAYEKVVAMRLQKDLAGKFGVELDVKDDSVGEVKKEILIGKTNREASKEALKDVPSENSYTIRKNGTKIVICAGKSETLTDAVDKWLLKMVNPNGKLCIPTTSMGYIYKPSKTKIDMLTVNGSNITNFSVYTEDSILKYYAQQVADLINNYTDISISVADKMPKNGIILAFDSENYKTESFKVEENYIYITPAYGNPKYVIEKLQDVFDGAENRELDITSELNSSNTIDYGEIYTKDELMELLQRVYDSDSVIVGELADNGINKDRTLISSGLEYFKEQTGEYPGLMSIDVASSFTYIKEGGDDMLHIAEELIGYAAKGGVIVTHAHTSCPTEPHTYRKGTMNYSQWNELFTEGSELNKAYYEILDLTADFFEILDKENVPVIWRPYHENNGNWFWYGAGRKDGIGGTRLEADYYKKLWITTYEYYTEVRGLDNLIWVYNPGIGDERDNLAAPLYCYPGDEYVDIVGIDWYSNGDYFVLENTQTYKDLASTGKIVNMCEFGLSGDALVEPSLGEKGEQKDLFSCRDALTYIKEMNKSGYKTSYWLFWQGNSSITGMGYGDEFMQSELTLGLNETRALLEEIMK